jgi:hypothetical protein
MGKTINNRYKIVTKRDYIADLKKVSFSNRLKFR